MLALFINSLGGVAPAAADSVGGISETDAVRLNEAYRLVEELGDEIWPGFSAVPMPIVLVAGDWEYLIDWPDSPPEGFEDLGVDPRLGRGVSARPRSFPPAWSASFPAFGPPAVVVIGTAEATGRTSTEWVRTVLHEHFHQLQYDAPGYYEGVEALDLSGGDQSGMWMLDYPFPYANETIGAQFAELAGETRKAMAATLDSKPGSEPWPALRELLQLLEAPDARYLSFQLWQEGIARHLELRAAKVAAAHFVPSPAFAALEDATSWADEAQALRQRIAKELEAVDLAGNGRVSFYALGAALGVLLDREVPGWEERYLGEMFALDKYVSPV